ncbi:MAG: alpha/beta hydrolase [Acidimicrobiales bacterium]|nr:alpha/beta hydrolase [Acidimicrobiales bacterium]
MRRFRRLFLAAWLATAVGLLATACGSGKSDPYAGLPEPSFGVTVPKKRPAYEPKFTKQSRCPVRGADDKRITVRIECGELTVPENRDKPQERLVTLQVAILHSVSPTPKPDPVVYLEGGPGGSALASLESWVIPPSPLLAERDVIIMDQRGTGYSNPRFTCGFEYNRASRTDQEIDALTKCFERYSGGQYDLDHYGTADAAADVADLRRALGLDQINLFGVSYGTRLALQVMAEFPEGIRSAVLDSNFPGGIRYFEEQPANAYRSFKAVFDACAADPSCNARYPNLEQTLAEVINSLDANPVTLKRRKFNNVTEDYQFKGTDFVKYLFRAMYDTGMVSALPKALTLSKRNPLVGLDYLFSQASITLDINDDVKRRPTFGDGLFYLIVCSEEGSNVTKEQLAARSAEIPEPARSALTKNTEEILDVCARWTPLPPEQVTQATIDIPALVLAGTMDPITPPVWSQIANSRLTKGSYVEVYGAGHGVFWSGDCAANLVTAFINDPAAGGGAGCPPVLNWQ